VELLARLGIVHEDLGGLELGTLGVSPAVHFVHKLLRALLVQHAERAAEERGKANAEHRTDVTCEGKIRQTEY